ncbi:unnamed protein product [Dicrocoelium dendriticum]|nr:unnamed protein product [Dicrocoelium dendriticum]
MQDRAFVVRSSLVDVKLVFAFKPAVRWPAINRFLVCIFQSCYMTLLSVPELMVHSCCARSSCVTWALLCRSLRRTVQIKNLQRLQVPSNFFRLLVVRLLPLAVFLLAT